MPRSPATTPKVTRKGTTLRPDLHAELEAESDARDLGLTLLLDRAVTAYLAYLKGRPVDQVAPRADYDRPAAGNGGPAAGTDTLADTAV